MKVFISADIEGIATTFRWKETISAEKEYDYHSEEMTQEVLAACNAAIDAGADEIVIKDAHGPGANIDAKRLPECARLIRGWSGHPYLMVEGIDSSFDAALFIGYHSEAGGGGNPLSHTISRRPYRITVNGETVSEFWIYSRCAALEGVPTVYLSGDKALCEKSVKQYPWLVATAVKEGQGDSANCLAPAKAQKMIYDDVRRALSQDLKKVPVPGCDPVYAVTVEYKEHADASRMSWYPGAERISAAAISFSTDSFFELARAFRFIL